MQRYFLYFYYYSWRGGNHLYSRNSVYRGATARIFIYICIILGYDSAMTVAHITPMILGLI